MNAALQERRRRLDDWLHNAAFPLWWMTGADQSVGGFHEAIDHDGSAVSAPRRARVQTRQLYSFAKAGQMGWKGPSADAVAHGVDFFLTAYGREDGLFRTLVTADGRPLDETVWLYDQAFALFAFAEASDHDPRLSLAARRIGEGLFGLRAEGGGFREASKDQPFQSNPHMHLLEAALAWSRKEEGGGWDELADEIAELALTRFCDRNGALHEFFAADWSLAPGTPGRIVEPGHQFEWAWLLERWSRLRSREDAHLAALRLFEIGTAHGVDPRRGVAFDQLLDDLTPHQAQARLWPQTERLKAALILAEGAAAEERARFLEEASAAADGLWKYLETQIAGLWRDKMQVDGRFTVEPAPASSFYHIVCALEELRRLTPLEASAASTFPS